MSSQKPFNDDLPFVATEKPRCQPTSCTSTDQKRKHSGNRSISAPLLKVKGDDSWSFHWKTERGQEVCQGEKSIDPDVFRHLYVYWCLNTSKQRQWVGVRKELVFVASCFLLLLLLNVEDELLQACEAADWKQHAGCAHRPDVTPLALQDESGRLKSWRWKRMPITAQADNAKHCGAASPIQISQISSSQGGWSKAVRTGRSTNPVTFGAMKMEMLKDL